MRALVDHFLDRLRTSFWFVPGLIVFVSGCLALAALRIDEIWGEAITNALPWLHAASVEGTRSLLSTAATSVLTLAGVTFSATLVALTLASSQFGPRLLRNFIAAKSSQVSLGVLLGNFVICLLILRAVRGVEGEAFVPHVASLFAFLVTLGSLATFILFIHSLATSLQADDIVANVHRDLVAALDRYFPSEEPDEEEESLAEKERIDWESFEGERTVVAHESGYLLAINLPTLVALAKRHELTCRVVLQPGHFVHQGEAILAWPADTALAEGDQEEFRKSLLIGRKRSPEQDFEFALRQLVEIGLRALSTGLNDPFTAINCIDFLGSAVRAIADRRLPHRHYSDADDVPRVHLRPTTFDAVLRAAFSQLRQASVGKPEVAIRILEALAAIAARCETQSRRDAVTLHASEIARTATSLAKTPMDKEEIALARAHVMRFS
jgi:uncharacterized membrane protein